MLSSKIIKISDHQKKKNLAAIVADGYDNAQSEEEMMNDILRDLESDDLPFLTNDNIEDLFSLLEKERDTKK